MSLRYHHSLPVGDVQVARRFYAQVFGWTEGRSTATWVDFDAGGNQMSFHAGPQVSCAAQGHVDGHEVPIPHAGLIFAEQHEFDALAERVRQSTHLSEFHGLSFVLDPATRYSGEDFEHCYMFIRDPWNNIWEFKWFRNPDKVFAT